MSRILHHVGVKDFKKVHQRKLGEQKEVLSEKIKVEEENKKIKEAAKPFKSDWRSTLTESEWYAISGSGPTNSASQTFAYGDPGSGIEVTLSGIGGVEAHPSTVTIDGETYDAPTYNQLAMQGYAKPLGFGVERRTDFQDVNPYLDASQEFAQAVGADYMMNARTEYDPVQALKDAIPSLIDMWNRIDNTMTTDPKKFIGLGPESESTIKSQIGFEKFDEIKNKWDKISASLSNSPKASKVNALRLAMKYDEADALKNEIDRQDASNYVAYVNELKTAFWDSVYQKTGVRVNRTLSNTNTSNTSKTSDSDQVKPKLDEPLRQRLKKIDDPNNPEYNKRFAPITADDEKKLDEIDNYWKSYTKHFPSLAWVHKIGIKYAKGDLSPETKSPGKSYDQSVLSAIRQSLSAPRHKITPGEVSNYDQVGINFIPSAVARLSIGRFNYEATSKGVRIIDKFDFNGNISLGPFELIPGLKDTAEFLVDIGQRRAAEQGHVMITTNEYKNKKTKIAIRPGDKNSPDTYYIDIDYIIPWSQVPADLQNKLDPNQKIVPIVKRNRRGRQVNR